MLVSYLRVHGNSWGKGTDFSPNSHHQSLFHLKYVCIGITSSEVSWILSLVFQLHVVVKRVAGGRPALKALDPARGSLPTLGEGPLYKRWFGFRETAIWGQLLWENLSESIFANRVPSRVASAYILLFLLKSFLLILPKLPFFPSRSDVPTHCPTRRTLCHTRISSLCRFSCVFHVLGFFPEKGDRSPPSHLKH